MPALDGDGGGAGGRSFRVQLTPEFLVIRLAEVLSTVGGFEPVAPKRVKVATRCLLKGGEEIGWGGNAEALLVIVGAESGDERIVRRSRGGWRQSQARPCRR